MEQVLALLREPRSQVAPGTQQTLEDEVFYTPQKQHQSARPTPEKTRAQMSAEVDAWLVEVIGEVPGVAMPGWDQELMQAALGEAIQPPERNQVLKRARAAAQETKSRQKRNQATAAKKPKVETVPVLSSGSEECASPPASQLLPRKDALSHQEHRLQTNVGKRDKENFNSTRKHVYSRAYHKEFSATGCKDKAKAAARAAAVAAFPAKS